jgi:hypothetical protein
LRQDVATEARAKDGVEAPLSYILDAQSNLAVLAHARGTALEFHLGLNHLFFNADEDRSTTAARCTATDWPAIIVSNKRAVSVTVGQVRRFVAQFREDLKPIGPPRNVAGPVLDALDRLMQAETRDEHATHWRSLEEGVLGFVQWLHSVT